MVYAIIPARSGSKGVPDKNIRPLAGHPLLAWSIAAASLAAQVDRVIVSTDSARYASIAEQYGAEVPFLRPPALATDTSKDRDFLLHAIQWMQKDGAGVPAMLVLLRPTTPLRLPAIIDDAVCCLRATPHASSLRSAHEASESPAKWFRRNDDGSFCGLMGDCWLDMPRQLCPKAYIPNGYVDVLLPPHVEAAEQIHGEFMCSFITPQVTEVDTQEDFAYLEYEALKGHPLLQWLSDRCPNRG